jgi:hypothetical protein
MRMATAMSKYRPPCLCGTPGGKVKCTHHRRLQAGEALYMVAGEPARFGRPWKQQHITSF